MTKKEQVDAAVKGKMTAMIFQALYEAEAPMTEVELKAKLGLKKDKVMKAVIKDLSFRRVSVEYDEETGRYCLTEFGKIMAQQYFMKQEAENKSKS